MMKKSFSYEPNASMSFIPIRKISLWCPIMKRKEITMWICVCPNQQLNLTVKNDGKRSFSYESKASTSFMTIRRMSLWCPIMKRKEITMWISVCPNWQRNFNLKKWWKEKLFLRNQSNQVFYPNEENKFMVHNHEKKRDYYVNHGSPSW